MSEMVCRAIDCSLRIMDLVGSIPPDELPETMVSEIKGRVEKVVSLLRGFEKAALLKTQKGREAAQEIEEAATDLEKALSSPGSGGSSLVIDSLSMLEQRVDNLQKTTERLKQVIT